MSRYRDLQVDDWPLNGPKVVLTFLRSLREWRVVVRAHHREWVQKSGIYAQSALARRHVSLCASLRLMQNFDHVDRA
eukprot:11219723-Lingulodinium_polyedra.AAC.1